MFNLVAIPSWLTQECFALNPCWNGVSICFDSRWFIILLTTMCSITLHGILVNEIGLTCSEACDFPRIIATPCSSFSLVLSFLLPFSVRRIFRLIVPEWGGGAPYNPLQIHLWPGHCFTRVLFVFNARQPGHVKISRICMTPVEMLYHFLLMFIVVQRGSHIRIH